MTLSMSYLARRGEISPLLWRSFRLPQQPGLYRCLLKGLPRFRGKHSIMCILQSLQYSSTRGKVFSGAWPRPFLRIKQDFSCFNRIIHALADASRWAQGHRHRLIKTHDAYSNATQRGSGRAVA